MSVAYMLMPKYKIEVKTIDGALMVINNGEIIKTSEHAGQLFIVRDKETETIYYVPMSQIRFISRKVVEDNE